MTASVEFRRGLEPGTGSDTDRTPDAETAVGTRLRARQAGPGLADGAGRGIPGGNVGNGETSLTSAPGRAGRTHPAVSLPVTLTLAVVTATACAGMARLFADRTPLEPILWAVAIGHAVPYLLGRVVRVPWALSVAVSALCASVFIPLLLVRTTTRHGLPTATTRRVLLDALREAWLQFGEVKPPVATHLGFTTAAACAAWLAATLADVLGLRLRLAAEALVPSAAIVVFTGALAPPDARLLSVSAYVAAGAVFAIAFRQWGAHLPWMGGARAGKLWPIGGAVVVAATVAVVTSMVTPRLPGADGEPLIDWKQGKRSTRGPRTAVSPLVSVRSRLLNQTDAEMFAVRAQQAAYWRLTSLERFDGVVWSAAGSYRPARERLPGSANATAEQDQLTQEVEIGALSSIWLPGAYRPTRYDADVGARFDRESGSLITERPSVRGLRYTLRSQLAHPEAEELRSATGSPPGQLGALGQYTKLPDDFPQRVRDLAAAVTDRAITPYGKARTLQDFFRSGDFVYDLSVPAPSDATDIEQFVFSDRRGYCEQFASSYAAMARALGLPARVAVGFTAGTLGADGRFHVTGRNAHAWPEVYLGEYGWVAFEPTPGRAIPGSEAYTGLGEREDASDPQAPNTTAPATVPAVVTTVASTGANPTPTTSPTANGPSSRRDDARGGLTSGFAVAFFVAVIAAAAAAFTGVASRTFSRRRRWADVHNEADELEYWWRKVEDSASWAGVGPETYETSRSFAGRVLPLVGEPTAAQLIDLAGAVDAARFAPSLIRDGNGPEWSGQDTPSTRVQQARHTAIQIETAVRASLSVALRFRRWVDPRLRRVRRSRSSKRSSSSTRRAANP